MDKFSKTSSSKYQNRYSEEFKRSILKGVATFFAAPVVLTGIAAYGIGDYFFDFSGTLDVTVGRESELWEP